MSEQNNQNWILQSILLLICIGLFILFTFIDGIFIYEGSVKWYHILEVVILIPTYAFMFFYPPFFIKSVLVNRDLYSDKVGSIGFTVWFILSGIYYGVFLTS